MRKNKSIITGSLQFLYPNGEVDFPGIYIDGSRAATFRYELMKALNHLDDSYDKQHLERLVELLGEGIIQTYNPSKVTVINFRDWAIFHPE